MEFMKAPTICKKRSFSKTRILLRVFIAFFLSLFLSGNLWAQTTYYSQGSVSPTVLGSWNTSRTGGGGVPANFTAGDIFVVQGTGGGLGAPHTMNVTAAWNITPAGTTGRVEIEADATLNLATNNVTAPAVQVAGTLTINTGRTFNLTNGTTPNDLLITATGIINNSGAFTMAAGTTGNISGIYYHNINGGTIPNVSVTWNAGSLCEIRGVTTTVPAGINQVFANLNWNCAAQTANITAAIGNLGALLGDFNIMETSGFDLILNNNLGLTNNDLIIGANGKLRTANDINVGTGTVTINGTFRTDDANGFYGAAATSIVNTPTIFLNAGSTIDYSLNGAQNITPSATFLPGGTTYSNLSTSTGGVKTLTNAVTVSGNLNIGSGTTFQVAAQNLTVAGTSTISGTLADNAGGGITNLANVIMQNGTIAHTTVDDVNISGVLSVTGGLSTFGDANIIVTGATTIFSPATLVISGTSTKYFDGGITNNLGGTWSTSGSPNIRIQSGLTNNGTMTNTGAGTYTFNNTQDIGGNSPITFQGPVIVNGAITVRNINNGGVTFQGALTGTVAGSTFTNEATMYYANNSIPMGARNFNANFGGNSVYYSLGSDQPIRNVTYSNLYTSGSGIKTAGGIFTVTNLNIGAGTTLRDAGNVITVNGNVSNYSVADGTGGIFVTTAAPHTITGNGSFQELDINNNATMAAAAASIFVNDLRLSGGSLSIDNNTLTVNNSITNAGGTITTIPAQSNITFNGTAAIAMPPSVTALNNFILNNTVGSSLSASLSVNGTLTLTQGALTYVNPNVLSIYSGPTIGSGYLTGGANSVLRTLGTSNITLPSSLIQTGGTIDLDIQNTGGLTTNLPIADDITIAAGATMTLGSNIGITGNITNSGTFTGTGMTSTFNRVGAGTQTIGGAGAGTYNFGSVIINTSNQLILNRNINAAGNWDLDVGTYTQNVANIVNFNGTGAQDIGGLQSTSFTNLTTSNTAVTISNNITVLTNLNFTTGTSAGKITLGSRDLTVANPATITNFTNQRFVVTNSTGRLVRSGAIAANFDFPVGNGTATTNYAPVRFLTGGSANVGVRAIGNKHPNNPSTSAYLDRYWAITTLPAGNLTAGNFRFTYGSGLVGTPVSAYYYGGAWNSLGGAIATPFTIALPGLPASDGLDVSGIDNDPPDVIAINAITPNTNTITDAYIGAGTFSLTIVYDEDMDQATIPLVGFPTVGENPAPTLAFSSGTWTNARTYVAYYTVSDLNLIMNNIDVSVSDGRDIAGNLQNPNPQTIIAGNGLNSFNINMANPAVLTAVPSTVLITDATATPFIITITYNVPMDQTAPNKPIVSFPTIGENPNLDVTLSYDVAASTWNLAGTVYTARFNLIDQGLCMNNVDIQISGGKDLIGNTQTVYTPPTAGAMNMFSISMSNPVEAGLPQTVCGSVTLGATASPYTTRAWTCNQAGVVYTNSTDPSATVTNLASGSNIFTWTVVYKGCTSVDNVTITNNLVSGVNAGSDQHRCVTTATMAATGTGIWSTLSGTGSATIATSSISPVINLSPGINTFRWTVTQGACTGFDDVIIYNDSPSISNAGTAQSTCNGSANLSANNPAYGTGLWTAVPPGAIFVSNTRFNTTVSGLSSGLNTLTWTITNGACTSTSNVAITYNLVPIITAGPDQQACNNSFVLSGTDPSPTGTGLWTVVTGVGTFTTPTAYNSPVTLVGRRDNTYRWTVTVGTCSASDDVKISNYSVLADAGPDDYTCDGNYTLQGTDPLTQDIVNPTINAIGTWSALPAMPPIAFTNVNAFNAAVSNLPPNVNTLTWTISNGFCTSFDEVDISNDRPTTPSAGPDATFCGVDFAAGLPTGYSSVYTALTANPVDLGRGELGVWTQVAGSGTFLDPTTSPTMEVDNLAQYAQQSGPDFWSLNPTVNTFRWTISYKNCVLFDEVTITNAAPDLADAGPPQTVCFDEVNLNAEDHGSRAQTHVWTIDVPNAFTVINNPSQWNTYVKALQTANTTFRWTKTNVINGLTCSVWDETVVTKTNNTGRPNAGPNQIVCADNTTLTATAPEFGIPVGHAATGAWAVLQGGGTFTSINSATTTVTNLPRQTNIFRWTVTNTTQGCIATADVNITNALPSDAISAPPTLTVCVDSTVLSATRPMPGSTGSWSVIGGGGTISNTTCQSFLCDVGVSNLGYGENTIRWTTSRTYSEAGPPAISKTCVLHQDVTVWNYELTANAGADQTVCVDNTSIEGNQPAGTTGIWDVLGGSGTLFNANSSITAVTTLSPGLNTLRWTLTNGTCNSEDRMQITNNNPENPSAGADQTLCLSTATLAANTPIIGMGTGVWSVFNGVGVFSNSLAATTTVSSIPLGTNTYRWTITKALCFEYEDVAITNNSVIADAGTDIDNICGLEVRNSTVTLSAAPPNIPLGETGIWSVAPSFGTIMTPTLYSSVVNGMDRGTNIFRWTLSNTKNGVTCTDDDLVSVIVYIPSTANAGSDQTVCRDAVTTITLNGNNPPFGKGTWSMVSGGGNILSPTFFGTTVNNLGLDRSFFRWSIVDNALCPASTDDVMITNNNVTANAGPDQALCIGTANLAASDPNTYNGGFAVASGKWTVSQGTGLTFDSDTRYNAIVSNLDDTQTNILLWTVSKGACSASDQVNIENNEFTLSAKSDQTVCDDWADLDGQQPSPGESGLWTNPIGGGVFVKNTLYNTRVNGISINPNTFLWTITNANCSASDDVIVYNNKVTSDAGLPQRVCSTTATLGGNLPPSGGSGNWTGGGAGSSIVTPSLFNTQVINLAPGDNKFTWTVAKTLNGKFCSQSSDVHIWNDLPTAALVEDDNAVCTNSTQLSVLTTPTIGTGVWDADKAVIYLNAKTSYNVNVSNLVLGTTKFTWTVTNLACTSFDDVFITNNSVVANAGADASTNCLPTYTLQGIAPVQGIGAWTLFSGGSAIIDNSLLRNSDVSNLPAGSSTFRWTVTLGACSTSDDVIITNNSVVAEAGSDMSTCNDFYPNLDGSIISGIGTGIWTSVGNTAIVTNSALFNTSVTGLDPGLNTFTLTVTSSQENCTDDDIVGITNSKLTANAGSNFETCDAIINLNAQDPFPATGSWVKSSGPAGIITIINANSASTQVTGLIAGVYSFTWTVTNGTCSNPATVVVTNSTPTNSNPTTSTPFVCNGSGNLQADATATGETGLWTTNLSATIAVPTASNTTASGMPLGPNTFTWTLTKGASVSCISSNSIVITNDRVIANAGVDKTTVCNNFVTLSGNNPTLTQGTGQWSDQTVTTATFVDNTLYNTLVNNLEIGTTTFKWTVSKGTCSANDNVVITNNQISANAGADQVTCNTYYDPLDGNDVSGVGGTGKWTTTGLGTFVQ